MILKPQTRKEQIVLISVVFFVIAFAYSAIRVRPLRREITKKQLELKTLGVSASGSTIDVNQQSLDSVMKEAGELEVGLGDIRGKLNSLEARLAAPGESASVKEEIARLADRCGVKVKKNSEVAAPKAANPNAKHDSKTVSSIPDGAASFSPRNVPDVLGMLYSRPLLKMELESTYPSLRNFLDQLHRLRNQVVVSRFKLERVSEVDSMMKAEVDLIL